MAHRSTRFTSWSVVNSAASSCRFDANDTSSGFPLSPGGPGGCFSKSAMVSDNQKGGLCEGSGADRAIYKSTRGNQQPRLGMSGGSEKPSGLTLKMKKISDSVGLLQFISSREIRLGSTDCCLHWFDRVEFLFKFVSFFLCIHRSWGFRPEIPRLM